VKRLLYRRAIGTALCVLTLAHCGSEPAEDITSANAPTDSGTEAVERPPVAVATPREEGSRGEVQQEQLAKEETLGTDSGGRDSLGLGILSQRRDLPATEPFVLSDDIERPVRLRGTLDDLFDLFPEHRTTWSTCVIQTVIDRDGRVTEVETLKPDNLHPSIRDSFAEILSTWRFEPAKKDGAPVAIYYHLVIHHCPFKPAED